MGSFTEGTRSYKTAVEKKCRECIYDPSWGNGGWRQQVKDCTSYDCPLYPVRPLPRVEDESIEKDTVSLLKSI